MKYVLGLLMVTVMAAGCGVKKPLYGRLDPYQARQIHFAEKDLQNHTAVGAPQVARDEAGLLFVTVPIRAATNLQLHVDYRVRFLDRNGMEVGRFGWLAKTLEPNVPDSVTANSTTPAAADFEVDFRYSK